MAGGSPESSWQATLTRRKAFCQGYAELLQKMCQIAGVPCEVISGYGRGFGFPIGQAENVRQSNHAWNAVKIQEHWHLVDVYLGRRPRRGAELSQAVRHALSVRRTAALSCTPTFPRKPNGSCSIRRCPRRSSPPCRCLEGRFFASGLRLSTPLRRLHPVGESVQFSLAAPEDVLLMASLAEPGKERGRQASSGRTLVRRGRNEINVLVTFPAAGRWGVRLFTKSRQDQGTYWQAATLEFEAAAGTPWTFAEAYSSVEGIDSFLESPVYVPLPAGTDAAVQDPRPQRPAGATLRRPEVDSHAAGGRRSRALPGDGRGPGRWDVKIVALPPHGGKDYWTLVDFAPRK